MLRYTPKFNSAFQLCSRDQCCSTDCYSPGLPGPGEKKSSGVLSKSLKMLQALTCKVGATLSLSSCPHKGRSDRHERMQQALDLGQNSLKSFAQAWALCLEGSLAPLLPAQTG